MIQRIQSKKGFTLVEVIVVLIILAILAAILVPQLTGYIDKANERAVQSEARAAVMALNTLNAESYAGLETYASAAALATAALELAELNLGTGESFTVVMEGGDDAVPGQSVGLKSAVYVRYGYTATYTYPTDSAEGAWTIEEN